MNKLNYIIIIITFVLIFIIFNYVYNIKKQPKSLEILQSNNFDFNSIQEILLQNQPTIFYQIMYDWVFIGDIHILDINQIRDIINVNKSFTKALENEMSAFSLFLSPYWKYNIIEKTDKDNYNNFRRNKLHRYFIGQITGVQRVFLCSPNQSKILENGKKIDKEYNELTTPISFKINNEICPTNFWNEKEIKKKPFNELQFIEIILKEGNILYIPQGWWYLSSFESDSIVLDIYNQSIFNNF